MNRLIPNKQCMLLSFIIQFLYLFFQRSFLKKQILANAYSFKLDKKIIKLHVLRCYHYASIHIFHTYQGLSKVGNPYEIEDPQHFTSLPLIRHLEGIRYLDVCVYLVRHCFVCLENKHGECFVNFMTVTLFIINYCAKMMLHDTK